MAGERTARVWAWIAAAREGDAPVSLAALCRAAANWLAVDGASVTAVSGLAVREPLSATGELSVRLEELLFTTGEGPGAEDFMFGSPMLIPDLELVTERWPGFVPAAVAAGARALFAFPLQAGAIRVGVLSLYRARAGAAHAAAAGGCAGLRRHRAAAAAGLGSGHQRAGRLPAAGRPVRQPRRGVPGDRDDLGAARREPGGGTRAAAGARVRRKHAAGRCRGRRGQPRCCGSTPILIRASPAGTHDCAGRRPAGLA